MYTYTCVFVCVFIYKCTYTYFIINNVLNDICKNAEMLNEVMHTGSIRKLKCSISQQCPVHVSLATCGRRVE